MVKNEIKLLKMVKRAVLLAITSGVFEKRQTNFIKAIMDEITIAIIQLRKRLAEIVL